MYALRLFDTGRPTEKTPDQTHKNGNNSFGKLGQFDGKQFSYQVRPIYTTFCQSNDFLIDIGHSDF